MGPVGRLAAGQKPPVRIPAGHRTWCRAPGGRDLGQVGDRPARHRLRLAGGQRRREHPARQQGQDHLHLRANGCRQHGDRYLARSPSSRPQFPPARGRRPVPRDPQRHQRPRYLWADSNIDSGIASSQYPLSFAISGDLFLANVIRPALPGAFPESNLSDFAYANGAITLAKQFNLSAVKAGAIWYTPTVTSLTITINANALKNATSGSVYLDLPNAYMDFSATTNNVLTYTPAGEAFTFQKDPNPVTSTNDRVPWYD